MLLYLHGVVILLKNIQLVLNGWTARGRQHIVVNCLDVIVNNKAIHGILKKKIKLMKTVNKFVNRKSNFHFIFDSYIF